MQTTLSPALQRSAAGRAAEDILRKCVHCGFCTATCPTYQLFGDEADGPRGRIYLIKQLLEGRPATAETRLHLDRCLLCRACETTCPSGVRYGRLLEIGRRQMDAVLPQSLAQRAKQALLRNLLSRRALFTPLFKAGQSVRGLLPAAIRQTIPPPQAPLSRPRRRHARRMLLLEGCVQPAMAPRTNAAAARVLDRFGISLITAPQAGCCGAVNLHNGGLEEGRRQARQLIDRWWPFIEEGGKAGVEAIVITASGCGVTIREYGELLADDPDYRAKAERVVALTRDLSEVVAGEMAAAPRGLDLTPDNLPYTTVAFHPPCTLQHGQKISGVVESILEQVGYRLATVADAHLCCGSAGTYSIMQPEISRKLLQNKLQVLETPVAQVIATANIGCQAHLSSGSSLPVVHWIELLSVE